MIDKKLDQIFQENFFKSIKLRNPWNNTEEYVEIFKNPSQEELTKLDSVKQYKECRVFLTEKDWYVASAINIMHSQIQNAVSELIGSFPISLVIEKDHVRVMASGGGPKLSSGEIDYVKNHSFINSLKSFGVKELRIGQEDIIL